MGDNTSQQIIPAGNAPGYMLLIILGVIQILMICCCCGLSSFIFGVLTIVFAVNANKAFKNANLKDYKSNITIAKTMNIIGWIILILVSLFLITKLLGIIPIGS